MAPERPVLGGQDDATGLCGDAAPDQGHHEPRHDGRQTSTDRQQGPIDRAEPGDPMACHDVGEPLRGAGIVLDPNHFVGEREHEVAAAFVLDELRQTVEPSAFASPRVLRALLEQSPRDHDGLVGSAVVAAGVGLG
jgi:hypothetical protein